MEMKTLVLLVLRASIVLTVFGLALGVSLDGIGYLRQRPGLLVRSLVAMYVVMLLVAVALAVAFALHPAVKIALVALAMSPVPPLLPRKELKAGGEAPYVIGLLIIAALLTIAFMPAAMALLGWAFDLSMHVPVGPVAGIVTITVLAPLAAGLLVRRVAPSFAARMAGPISTVATVLLVVAIVPVLFVSGPEIFSLIGNGTVAAFVAFSLIGLAAGDLLGGPGPANRVVLALATACRHPGVAVAIATSAFPDQKLAVPAVGLYLLVVGITSTVYLAWIRRHRARHAGQADRPASKRSAA